MPEIKFLKCSDCGKKFSKEEHLKQHKLDEHPESVAQNRKVELTTSIDRNVEFNFTPAPQQYENSVIIQLECESQKNQPTTASVVQSSRIHDSDPNIAKSNTSTLSMDDSKAKRSKFKMINTLTMNQLSDPDAYDSIPPEPQPESRNKCSKCCCCCCQ